MTGAFVFPRVQAIPDVDRISFRIDGVERLAYHFGERTGAPFLFPIVGPSGAILTRLGNPQPSDQSPDRSVWLGHANLAGINFWEDPAGTDTKIRHRSVTQYREGSRGGATIQLDWWARGEAVLHQTLELELAPTNDKGFALDIRARFESTGRPVELGQTELGFLGARVASTMSESHGGGRVISAERQAGASAVSGSTARWIDYSGPSAPNVVEGICLMDHPTNPQHPTRWNVQPNGLMCAAFNATSPYGVARNHSLELRYRLLVHAGAANPEALDRAWEDFARSVQPRTIA